jgi:hypothetical protein
MKFKILFFENLVTPFNDMSTLTRKQQKHNFVQSSVRMVVEISIFRPSDG